jgi:serine/threonine protein kinase
MAGHRTGSVGIFVIGTGGGRGPLELPPLVGNMIGEKLGKYTILESLGTGSMGTVYRADDPDGSVVALKLVRSQVLYDIGRRERFLQGILAASLVHDERLCPILEIGDENDDFFLVMPWLEGKTLERYLEHKPIPWQQAVDLTIGVGEALGVAHAAGVVHRGVKPSNIWLRKDGTVVVSDCAVARFTEMAGNSRRRSIGPRVDFADTLIPLAALSYMSPEQVRGDEVDLRTDIFSLGAVLYEMLTGRHPFDARNSLSRMSAILEGDPPLAISRLGVIPAELNRILRKALAKRPADRYPDMAEFIAELRVVRESGAEEAGYPEGAGDLRRSRLAWWMLALALLIAIAAGLLYFLKG